MLFDRLDAAAQARSPRAKRPELYGSCVRELSPRYQIPSAATRRLYSCWSSPRAAPFSIRLGVEPKLIIERWGRQR